MLKEFFRRSLLCKVVLTLVVVAFISQGAVYATSSKEHSKNTSVESKSGKSFQKATVGESRSIPRLWWLAPIGAVCALFFTRKFYKEVMSYPRVIKRWLKLPGMFGRGFCLFKTAIQGCRHIFYICIYSALCTVLWIKNSIRGRAICLSYKRVFIRALQDSWE